MRLYSLQSRALYTQRRLRPFARRAASILRPAFVDIRARKPWHLARLRVLGWYVRFILIPFHDSSVTSELYRTSISGQEKPKVLKVYKSCILHIFRLLSSIFYLLSFVRICVFFLLSFATTFIAFFILLFKWPLIWSTFYIGDT